jgi:hypothetical protein
MGANGSGILNVNGGLLIDNGWFHVGNTVGSATFNQTGGTVYILPNTEGNLNPGAFGTAAAANGGLAINQASTNATVNISGGTLYCCRIGFDGTTGIPFAPAALTRSTSAAARFTSASAEWPATTMSPSATKFNPSTSRAEPSTRRISWKSALLIPPANKSAAPTAPSPTF